jgi:hypothetical protein
MDFKTVLCGEEDIGRIVSAFHLQPCTKGNRSYYESSEYGKFDGIHLKIEGRTLKVVCSVQKIFSKYARGNRLDNSGSFTVSEGRAALNLLFDSIGIDVSHVTVTYFEIGLNMKMSRDPSEYIKRVMSTDDAREMYSDADYKILIPASTIPLISDRLLHICGHAFQRRPGTWYGVSGSFYAWHRLSASSRLIV